MNELVPFIFIHHLQKNGINLCMGCRDLKTKRSCGDLHFDQYGHKDLKTVVEALSLPKIGKRWTRKAMYLAFHTYVDENCPENCLDLIK